MLKANLTLEQQADAEQTPLTLTELLLTASVLLYVLQKIARGRRLNNGR